MKKIFLLFFIIIASLSKAQNIFILGKLRPDDDKKIKYLVNILRTNYKIKSLYIYYNSPFEQFYKFSRKDPNNEAGLEQILKAAINDASKITSPTSSFVETFKSDIGISHPNFVKSDFKGNCDFESFKKSVDEKITYYKMMQTSGKNIAMVIAFQSLKPRITIETPKEGDTLVNSKLIVSGTTTEPLGEVHVRLNGGAWKRASIKESFSQKTEWETEINLQDFDNIDNIEAIAFNQYQEKSDIEKINGVYYKKKIKIAAPIKLVPQPLSINYLFPKDYEVVGKCVRNYNYHYKFKFSIFDPKINKDSVKIVFENFNNEIILESSIENFLKKDRDCLGTIRISDNRTDYCLFVIFSDLRFKDPCEIDDEDTYYYYFIYNDKYISTDKVLIHFPSFEAGHEVECDCN